MYHFRHASLNSLALLFQFYLYDKRYQLELYIEIMRMSLEELCEENENIGSLYTALCYDPQINQHPHFEAGFIYLVNTINFRLMTMNARNQAASMLLAQNQEQKPIFLIELLRLKYFAAAQQTFKFIRFATAESIISKTKARLAFYQTNKNGLSYLKEMSQFLRVDEVEKIALILIHARIDLNIHPLFIQDWLYSILNAPIRHPREVFLNKNIHAQNRQGFLSAFLLMLKHGVFEKSSWRLFYDIPGDDFSVMDKIIGRKELDDSVLSEYLYFIKRLFNQEYLSYEELTNVIFFHKKAGYSPLLQILYLGKIGRLQHYLDFINVLFEKGHMAICDIRETLMKTNSHGYTALYQAINNFSPDIPSYYLNFYMKFFSVMEVYNTLTYGSENMQTGRQIRYYCAHDKEHWMQTNGMMTRLRRQIERDLQIEPLRSEGESPVPGYLSPIQVDRRFSPINCPMPR